jgi:ABC-2 type transport system ATP-binding protein
MVIRQPPGGEDRQARSYTRGMSARSAVEVRNLVKRYGRTTAADRLSFTVERGSVTGILGPNGAGKTTAIEICEGFRRPDSGMVRVLGSDPIADGPRLRPRVGVMLQDGGGYPGARAGELLAYSARLYAHPLNTADLADRLGINRRSRTPYRRLSGGERQRLHLALALVGRPELVFLDEPTAGMDAHARRAAWDLIHELRDSGVTVVLTTHLIDEAERLSDHIVIIDRGRAVAAGAPEDLTGTTADRVLTFRGPAGLDVTALASALKPGTIVDEPVRGTYRVQGHIEPALLATVTAWCASNGVLADRITTGRRSLEDVFLDLTGRELASPPSRTG